MGDFVPRNPNPNEPTHAPHSPVMEIRVDSFGVGQFPEGRYRFAVKACNFWGESKVEHVDVVDLKQGDSFGLVPLMKEYERIENEEDET